MCPSLINTACVVITRLPIARHGESDWWPAVIIPLLTTETIASHRLKSLGEIYPATWSWMRVVLLFLYFLVINRCTFRYDIIQVWCLLPCFILNIYSKSLGHVQIQYCNISNISRHFFPPSSSLGRTLGRILWSEPSQVRNIRHPYIYIIAR